MGHETARQWAVEEFGAAKLADARWRTRLVGMGAHVARRPGGKVAQVFADAGARQGAYGLLESRDVHRAQIAEAMFGADALRCACLPFVFVPVDGSSVTVTDRTHAKRLGCVGTHAQGARGLKVISALLVSPQGVPMGLGSQIWWSRSETVAQQHREMRRTRDKETQHWLEAMEQTRRIMAAKAPQTRLWFQIDREGDAWPIIMEADKDGHWFTIRGTHNRRVKQADGSLTYLRTLVGAEPVAMKYTLMVSAGPKRSARTATMVVRACAATMEFKDKRTKRRFPKTVHVVLAKEEGTAPAGERPLEWLLLTNRGITRQAELAAVVDGYAQRWRIEDFHRTWKSGACDIEETQLRSAQAIEKWATILAAVAVRIERLKLLSRQEPERPATDELSPQELRAIALLRFGKQAKQKVPDGATPTLGQAVTWLAEIGGYTGKSSGGPPGSITISRGLREVLVVVRALAATETNCD